MSKPKRPVGRPPAYSPELAERVLDLLAEGVTLTAICKLDGMPARSTVEKWAISIPEFADRYTLARRVSGTMFADDALEESKREDVDPALLRIRVDTLKWAASKFYPRMFGDKIQTENASVDLTKLDDDQLAALERGVPLTEVLRMRPRA